MTFSVTAVHTQEQGKFNFREMINDAMLPNGNFLIRCCAPDFNPDERLCTNARPGDILEIEGTPYRFLVLRCVGKEEAEALLPDLFAATPIQHHAFELATD